MEKKKKFVRLIEEKVQIQKSVIEITDSTKKEEKEEKDKTVQKQENN